jgi:hypothetical protein
VPSLAAGRVGDDIVLAQALTLPEIALQQLWGRPLAIWSQTEREFGFGNWDRIFPARTIARGPSVHPLPHGVAAMRSA